MSESSRITSSTARITAIAVSGGRAIMPVLYHCDIPWISHRKGELSNTIPTTLPPQKTVLLAETFHEMGFYQEASFLSAG